MHCSPSRVDVSEAAPDFGIDYSYPAFMSPEDRASNLQPHFSGRPKFGHLDFWAMYIPCPEGRSQRCPSSRVFRGDGWYMIIFLVYFSQTFILNSQTVRRSKWAIRCTNIMWVDTLLTRFHYVINIFDIAEIYQSNDIKNMNTKTSGSILLFYVYWCMAWTHGLSGRLLAIFDLEYDIYFIFWNVPVSHTSPLIAKFLSSMTTFCDKLQASVNAPNK